MDVSNVANYVTRSHTHRSYLPANGDTTITDAVDAPITRQSEHGQTNACLVTPSEISKLENPLDTAFVVRRPSTAQLLTTHQKAIKDWHRKRKKKLMDRRRTSLNKLGFSVNSSHGDEGVKDCNLTASFFLPTSTNKQVTNDFHSLKIRRLETGGSWFDYVVPGVVMRDFLMNFKTGDFYQKVKSLMQVIPGNSGTSYYQFHWMTTKKMYNDTNIYDWRDNELMETATSYSLESMMHQIMDQLASTGDILLEGEETCWQFYPSLVFTKGPASHQKPHLDFPRADCMRKGRVPFVLHLPLCEEGLALQIWSTWGGNGTKHMLPKLIFVPFGCALLLRADIYHAGCYGTRGNLRLHGMILPPDLPRNTRSLQHLRVGTNTAFQDLQRVNPMFVLDLLATEKNKKKRDHYISLLQKTIVTPMFWVLDPLSNIHVN